MAMIPTPHDVLTHDDNLYTHSLLSRWSMTSEGRSTSWASASASFQKV